MAEETVQHDATSHGASLLNVGYSRRTPVILQTEASECGLACIAMILGYHGYKISLSDIRQQHTMSLKGMTLERVLDIASAYQLTGRAVRLEPSELLQLQTPCVLHWNMDHFVVLRNVSANSIEITDPAAGERRIPMESVDKHFTGVAVEFVKGPTFQRKKAPNEISLAKLAGSVQGLGKALFHIMGFALALEILSILAPQFSQVVVDQVLADRDDDLLAFLGVSFTAVLILQVAVSALRGWTITWIGSQFSINWTGNVFRRLLDLPQSYFMKRHVGDIVSRFNAVSAIQQGLTTQVVTAIVDGMMAIVTGIVLVIYSAKLASAVAASVTIYALLRLAYFRALKESNLSQIVVNARQQSHLLESIRGSQTIRLHNKSALRSSQYLNVTAESINTSVGIQRLNLLFSALGTLTTGALRIAILWWGGSLALSGQFTAGMLVAFASYADQFASRATGLVEYLVQIRLLRLQGERIADIVTATPEQNLQRRTTVADEVPSIELRSVSFRYAPGEPWIIKNCSLRIDAGQSIAIVGPSGCGKSTLAKLILGLLDPETGAVEVDGVDLRKLGKVAFRDVLGSVTPEDVLFTGSIAENISFFDPRATLEDVETAASLAGIHEEIKALPMGYFSLVGDMGSALSGGQQQRLHLARAIYRKPRILVLDEATSHLDLAREKSISAALKGMSITRIIIAHRPETIASADHVYLLDQGSVIKLQKASPAIA